MRTVVASQLGTEGFVAFVGHLRQLAVVSAAEKSTSIALHGAVMRATLPPLDDGRGIDEQTLAALVDELGAQLGARSTDAWNRPTTGRRAAEGGSGGHLPGVQH